MHKISIVSKVKKINASEQKNTHSFVKTLLTNITLLIAYTNRNLRKLTNGEQIHTNKVTNWNPLGLN